MIYGEIWRIQEKSQALRLGSEPKSSKFHKKSPTPDLKVVVSPGSGGVQRSTGTWDIEKLSETSIFEVFSARRNRWEQRERFLLFFVAIETEPQDLANHLVQASEVFVILKH